MTTTKGTVEISRSNAKRILDLLPMMLSHQAVVFDIETTGLNSRWHEIVSFAAKSPSTQQGIQTLIMPKRPQDLLKKDGSGTCAYDINGIHPDDLVGSPTFEQAYPQIREFLEGKHWVCWNEQFDVNFLDVVCDKRGFELISRTGVSCAMKLLSPLAGQRGQRRGKIANVQVSDNADDRVRWQKLSSLAKRMGIDTRQAHNAAADVDMTIQIMQWATENIRSLPPPSRMNRTSSRKTSTSVRRDVKPVALPAMSESDTMPMSRSTSLTPSRKTSTSVRQRYKHAPLPPLSESDTRPTPRKTRGCFPWMLLAGIVTTAISLIVIG